jgi:hypothetical protein
MGGRFRGPPAAGEAARREGGYKGAGTKVDRANGAIVRPARSAAALHDGAGERPGRRRRTPVANSHADEIEGPEVRRPARPQTA